MRMLVLMLMLAAIPCAAQAQVIRTVPVTVVNQPAVQATEDVDNPAFQPVQFWDFEFLDISGPNTLLSAGVRGDPVPAGKRLVIQHASGRVSSAALDSSSCQVRVLDGLDEEFKHELVLHRRLFGNTLIDAFSQPIAMYADAGREVGLICSVLTDGDTAVRFGYSGYYVDAD